MLTMIKEILEASGADGYQITDTVTTGWEFYFIRRKLDQHRVRETRSTNVRVFVKSEDGGFLGSAEAEIAPTADRAEAEKLIASLVNEAGYVQNPVYTLNPPAAAPLPAREVPDVSAIAGDVLSAMRDVPETAEEDLNSYEIFVNVHTRHIINSEGVDVTEVYPSTQTELVINARDEEREIELYRMVESGTCDRDHLIGIAKEAMAIGRDRLRAVPTPALKRVPVILRSATAVAIYDYYLTRVNAAYIVQKLSDAEKGVSLMPDAKGDTITLASLAGLANSSLDLCTDGEGAPIEGRILIRDGVPEAFWGSRQFRSYLGMTDGSGVYNYSVEGGSASAEEMRSGAYLEAVEFSDFQCDPVTGDIAGEIRLGYWHDGKTTVPVTGGSVSGSMKELSAQMTLSRETVQENNAVVPALIRLEDVSVTGAEG